MGEARRKPLAPTFDELARWKRLVRLARAQAERPVQPAGDLKKAADAARKAVAPSWAAFETCCKLVRLGQMWPGMNNAQRREKAIELQRLADAVEAAITVHGAGETNEVAPEASGSPEPKPGVRPWWDRD